MSTPTTLTYVCSMKMVKMDRRETRDEDEDADWINLA